MTPYSRTTQKYFPCRPPGINVNTAEAKAQPSCPLFRLPVELRQLIYEHVLGAGTIHVIIRSCNPSENPIIRLSTTTLEDSGQKTEHDYQKLTYSTCRHPSSFKARYALSKTSSDTIPVMYHNSRGELPYFPGPQAESIILMNWSMQHADCYSGPQRDMVQQRYASSKCNIYHSSIPHHPKGCSSCVVHREDLERLYGPPTARQGLKKFHADSAVSVDGLLRSCRRIYDEARTLPFKLYTFDVNGEHLWDVMGNCKWLEPWQAAEIERMHVSCDDKTLDNVRQVLKRKVMPRLRMLEMDFEGDLSHDFGPHPQSWADLPEKGKREVVVGFDRDWKVSRQERRVVAERFEGMMSAHVGRDGRTIGCPILDA